MAQLYRIEELTTEGWTLVDNTTVKLTKEQCDAKLNWYVETGNVNPNRLSSSSRCLNTNLKSMIM